MIVTEFSWQCSTALNQKLFSTAQKHPVSRLKYVYFHPLFRPPQYSRSTQPTLIIFLKEQFRRNEKHNNINICALLAVTKRTPHSVWIKILFSNMFPFWNLLSPRLRIYLGKTFPFAHHLRQTLFSNKRFETVCKRQSEEWVETAEAVARRSAALI